MTSLPYFINASLFLSIILLVMAAYMDLKIRRIPNIYPSLLFGAFIGYALLNYLSGAMNLGDILWAFGLGGCVFAVLALMFAFNLMGGGDVKLITSLSLFAGKAYLTPLLVLIAFTGGLVAIGLLISRRFIEDKSKASKVPYGVAISISGVWLLLKLSL